MSNIADEKIKLIKDNYNKKMKNEIAIHLNKVLRHIVYSVLLFLCGQGILAAVDMKILPENPPFIIWFGTLAGFIGIILTIITTRFYLVLKKELQSKSEHMWIKIEHKYNKLIEQDYYRDTPVDEMLEALLIL